MTSATGIERGTARRRVLDKIADDALAQAEAEETARAEQEKAAREEGERLKARREAECAGKVRVVAALEQAEHHFRAACDALGEAMAESKRLGLLKTKILHPLGLFVAAQLSAATGERERIGRMQIRDGGFFKREESLALAVRRSVGIDTQPEGTTNADDQHRPAAEADRA